MKRNESIVIDETSPPCRAAQPKSEPPLKMSASISKPVNKKSFFPRLLSMRGSSNNSSTLSLTSIDEDESLLSGEPSNSPKFTRRVSVLANHDALPSEVEVIYDENEKVDANQNGEAETKKQQKRSLSRGGFGKRSALEDEAVALCHFQRAMENLTMNSLDQTLMYVEKGLQIVKRNSTLYWQLLTLKAEALGRSGDYEQSLLMYEQILEHKLEDRQAADLVSLYYACARLSGYLHDYQKALDYYTQELLHTRAVSGESLAVARIYHDLASVAKNGIGDWALALVYYEQALQVEMKVWKRAKETSEATGSAAPDKQAQDLQEATQLIQETKKSMGRIQFALGNIDDAMRLSSHRFSFD